MNKMDTLSFVPLYKQIIDSLFDVSQRSLTRLLENVSQQLTPSVSFEWIPVFQQLIDRINDENHESPVLLAHVHITVQQMVEELGGRGIKISPHTFEARIVEARDNGQVSLQNLFDIDLVYDILLPFLYQHATHIEWTETNPSAQMTMLMERWSRDEEKTSTYFIPVPQQDILDYLQKQWSRLLHTKYNDDFGSENGSAIQDKIQQTYDDYVRAEIDTSTVDDSFLEPAFKFRQCGRLSTGYIFIPMSVLRQQKAYIDMMYYEQQAQLLTQFFHELPESLTQESAYYLPTVPKKTLSPSAFYKYVQSVLGTHNVEKEWADLFRDTSDVLEQQSSNSKRFQKALEYMRFLSETLKNSLKENTMSMKQKSKINIDKVVEKYEKLKSIIETTTHTKLPMYDSFVRLINYFGKYALPKITMRDDRNNHELISMHTLMFRPLYSQVFATMYPQKKSSKDAMLQLLDRIISCDPASLEWMNQEIKPILQNVDKDRSDLTLNFIQTTMKSLHKKLDGSTIRITPWDDSNIRIVSASTLSEKQNKEQELFEIDFFYDLLFPFLYSHLHQFFTKGRDSLFIDLQYIKNVLDYRRSSSDDAEIITLPVSCDRVVDFVKHVWVALYDTQKQHVSEDVSQELIQEAFEKYAEQGTTGVLSKEALDSLISIRNLGKIMFGSWFVPRETLESARYIYDTVLPSARELVSFYNELPLSLQEYATYKIPGLPLSSTITAQKFKEYLLKTDIREKGDKYRVILENYRKKLEEDVKNCPQNYISSDNCFLVRKLYDLFVDSDTSISTLEEIQSIFTSLYAEHTNNDSKTLESVLTIVARRLVPLKYIFIKEKHDQEAVEKAQHEKPEESISLEPKNISPQQLVPFHDILFVPLYHKLLSEITHDQDTTNQGENKIDAMIRLLRTLQQNERDAEIMNIIISEILVPLGNKSNEVLLSLDSVQRTIGTVFEKLDKHALYISPNDLKIRWVTKNELVKKLPNVALFDIDVLYDIVFPFIFEHMGRIRWYDDCELHQFLKLIEKWIENTAKKVKNEQAEFNIPVQRREIETYLQKTWLSVLKKYEQERLNADIVARVSHAYKEYSSQQKNAHISRDDFTAAYLLRSIGRLMFAFWYVPLYHLSRQPVFETSPREAKDLVHFFHKLPASLKNTDEFKVPPMSQKNFTSSGILRFLEGLLQGKGNVFDRWNDLYLMAFRFFERMKQTDDKTKTEKTPFERAQNILDEIHVETTKNERDETSASFQDMQTKLTKLQDILQKISHEEKETRVILENIILFLSRSLFPYVYILRPEGVSLFSGPEISKGDDSKKIQVDDKTRIFEYRILEIKKVLNELEDLRNKFKYAYALLVLQKNKRFTESSSKQSDTKRRKEIQTKIDELQKTLTEKRKSKAELEEKILISTASSTMFGRGLFDEKEDRRGINKDVLKRRVDELEKEITDLEKQIDKLHKEYSAASATDDKKQTSFSEKEALIEQIEKTLEQKEFVLRDKYQEAQNTLRDYQENKNNVLLEKVEYLYRDARSILEEGKEMVELWKKRENVELSPSDLKKQQKEERQLHQKWENELDHKERLLIKREQKLQDQRQCLSWQQKVGKVMSPSFNIDVFEIITTKIDNFEQRLEPFENNTNTDLARFINDAFQYVDGSSKTEDGKFNILAEQSFKNAYNKAIDFGYRVLDRYRRFHFDFIMKRIRRELDYIKLWRNTPGYKEQVAQYQKYFEKVDGRLQAISEHAQQFLLTEFEKNFSKNMERFDLSNIVDNIERMDYLTSQRQVLAKAGQVAKQVQNDYFDKISLVQMFIDRQFLLSLVLNGISIGLFFMAMHWGEKTYKGFYEKNNYANNPSLFVFVGSMMGYYIVMQVILIAILMTSYIFNFDTYYIDSKFIYNFSIEQGFQTLVFGGVAAIVTVICQNVSLFRYDQEALRGFRALKEILIPVFIVLFIVPLFYLQ